MTSLGANSKNSRQWVKDSTVVERIIEDELLLLDDEAGAIFNLNAVGAAVWRLLYQPITSEEIVTVVVAAFPENEESQIQTDVDLLIQQLYSKGLISQQVKG